MKNSPARALPGLGGPLEITSPILLPGMPSYSMKVNPGGVHRVSMAKQFADTFQRMYDQGDHQGKDPTKFLRQAYPFDVYTLLDPEHGEGLQFVFMDKSRALFYSNERDIIYTLPPSHFYKPPKIGNRYKGIDNV